MLHKPTLHQTFLASLFLKALNAGAEIVGGVLALFVGQTTVVSIITLLARNELLEDPDNVLAHYILNALPGYTDRAQLFVALYLLLHGVVKLALVYGLWRRKLWVYPVAISVFLLFSVYQFYLYLHNGGLPLLVLTGIDLLVVVLTILEYRNIRKEEAQTTLPSTTSSSH